MKIAYIILAYNKPAQLGRLIKKLNHKDCAFFLHIDKKSKFEDFKNELENLPVDTELTLLPRTKVYWGAFGMVQATLSGLNLIVNEHKFQRIILLSGQDYPIKSNVYINEFFESNENNYIPYFSLPSEEWDLGGMKRIQNYHFRFMGRRFTSPPLSPPVHLHSKIFYNLLKLRFKNPRMFPKGLKPFGGFSWWRITDTAAKEILNFLENRPDFIKFFNYTHCADEMFFQTILLNTKNGSIINSVVNSDVSFIKWTRGEPHPHILKSSDFEEIQRSDALFARKFDSLVDSKIFDLIDDKINS